MTELARLKFYATQPHPCSYLPEEQATTLFLDPSQPMDTQLYASLSEVGFAPQRRPSLSSALPALHRLHRRAHTRSPASARTASSGASSSAMRNCR